MNMRNAAIIVGRELRPSHDRLQTRMTRQKESLYMHNKRQAVTFILSILLVLSDVWVAEFALDCNFFIEFLVGRSSCVCPPPNTVAIPHSSRPIHSLSVFGVSIFAHPLIDRKSSVCSRLSPAFCVPYHRCWLT